MSPLERAARALARYRYEHGADPQGLDRDRWVDKYWPEFANESRAVLQAIREPSEGMIRAGSSGGDWPHSAETWRHMIDAALEEG